MLRQGGERKGKGGVGGGTTLCIGKTQDCFSIPNRYLNCQKFLWHGLINWKRRRKS